MRGSGVRILFAAPKNQNKSHTRAHTRRMQQVFSPRGPVLRFNELSTETDRSEQQGMMFLYAGAVTKSKSARFDFRRTKTRSRIHQFLESVSKPEARTLQLRLPPNSILVFYNRINELKTIVEVPIPVRYLKMDFNRL